MTVARGPYLAGIVVDGWYALFDDRILQRFLGSRCKRQRCRIEIIGVRSPETPTRSATPVVVSV